LFLFSFIDAANLASFLFPNTSQKSCFYYAKQGLKKFRRGRPYFKKELKRNVDESSFYDNNTPNYFQIESGMFCSTSKNYLPLYLIVN